MSDEFIGSVVLECGDMEIECISVSIEISTGAREIVTMRSAKNKGAAAVLNGIRSYKIVIEVPIPTDGSEPRWLEIGKASITVAPIGKGTRDVFTDCSVESMSSKYKVGDVAVRELRFIALVTPK